jgi:lycopene elongase/hydratase (dihydrobisanhydrobacterioruberin-forming)
VIGPKNLLKISRPRFWIYIFGPYLVGLAAGIQVPDDLLRAETIIFGLYFLLPANLLIYGVNDIYDYETDRRNPKKAEYETLVSPETRWPLTLAIFGINLPFVSVALYLESAAALSIALFLFFSIFYSAPPIRAKAKPVIDSIFNVLYILPGIFAFQMASGAVPPISIIAAGWLWSMAMHAFSAVPDTRADREAGISTVATFLGRSGTLVFCSFLYLAAAAASSQESRQAASFRIASS